MEENQELGNSLGLLGELDNQKPFIVNIESLRAITKKLLRGDKKVRMIWNGKLKRYVEL